jgi:2,4-dienoyl-CoA reductase-like NADH-dependent reductase (Old Yellow Enzyme family)
MTFSVFDRVNLGNLEIPNGLVMAAAADNLTGDNGAVTEAHINRLVDLASGGVGLIITGGVGIHDSARSGPDTPNMDRNDAVSDYKKLTDKVHDQGAKIVLQLVHSGIWTSKYQNSLGREAIGASVLPEDTKYLNEGLMPAPGKYHAATHDELDQVIEAFAKAAYNGKKAGFDAVEVHAAHDSLLSQFLSPITNQRTDKWGGSTKNRCQLPKEVGQAMRDKVRKKYPLIIKLGLQDGFEGGKKLEDGVKSAEILADDCFDILEISLGLQGGNLPETVFRPVPKDGYGYFHQGCQEIKKRVSNPIIMTGGLRSLDKIEEMIQNNETDMVGMCRPFIREPDLVNRWQSGEISDAACISCNKCVFALGRGMPLDCYVNEKINM